MTRCILALACLLVLVCSASATDAPKEGVKVGPAPAVVETQPAAPVVPVSGCGAAVSSCGSSSTVSAGSCSSSERVRIRARLRSGPLFQRISLRARSGC